MTAIRRGFIVSFSRANSVRAFSAVRQSIAPKFSPKKGLSASFIRPMASLLHSVPMAQWGLMPRYYTSEDGAHLTIDQVQQRVLTVLKAFDKVPGERVQLDSNFIADLGLDSLDVVEVVMAMEEEFNMEIPDDVADNLKSAKEAAEYIYKTLESTPH